MSADSNPLSPAGASSHVSGIVPEHRVANEGTGRKAQKRKQKRRRSPKRAQAAPESPDVDQSLPDSRDPSDQDRSIDYLA